MIAPIIATNATKPIVNPTAPPVLSPPLFFLVTICPCPSFGEFGGAVGVTVTVRTCPVIVSSDMIGVGVHVIDVDGESSVDDSGGGVVDGVVFGGVGFVVGFGFEPPAVLVGSLPGMWMYPHSPESALPHKSSGYPTQGALQSLTEVVSPGSTLVHQQLGP